MASKKNTKRVENGVVYTTPEIGTRLAEMTKEVCDIHGVVPTRIHDPCCGRGDLLWYAKTTFGLPPAACSGTDIDAEACTVARSHGLECYPGDLFDVDVKATKDTLYVLNPPYVGRSNLSRIVGKQRFDQLKKTYKTAKAGSCDLAGYVLRHVLEQHRPTIMGVVVTNTIFQGATRRVGTYWALRNGYIISACSESMPWGDDVDVSVQLLVLVDTRVLGIPEMEIL